MLNHLLRSYILRRSGRRPAAKGTARGRWDLVRLEDRTVPAIGFATGSGVGLSGSPVNVYDTTGALLITFTPIPPIAVMLPFSSRMHDLAKGAALPSWKAIARK